MKIEKWIQEHLHDDVNELALHASRYPEVDMREVLVQIRGWQIAEKKLPLWAQTEDIRFPDHLPLEQCSSQLTAAYKASLITSLPRRETMTDLTGGFGVDAAMIARHFGHLTFVEQREDLCRLARHNFPLLGLHDFDVVNADALDVLPNLPHQDLIFIDPARRDVHGRKTVVLSDCAPDVTELAPQLLDRADTVMVKLSPMLDITAALRQLQDVQEVHVVSVDNECKELLLVLSNHSPHPGAYGEPVEPPLITCVNIHRDVVSVFFFTRSDEEQSTCRYTSNVATYLYEPNASVMKACPFRTLAKRYGLDKLHPNSHLYTSDMCVPDFPGRCFRVEDVVLLNKQTTRQLAWLRQANLSVRNFPVTVADLRRRFRLSDGGDTYLFATTLADMSRVVIVCKRTE